MALSKKLLTFGYEMKTPTYRLTRSNLETDINRPVGVFFQEESLPKKTLKPKFVMRLRTSISLNSVETSYVLRSIGRRTTVIQYLFHKWLFAELTRTEYEIFLLLPEVITNNMIYSALRARTIGHSKKTIRKTLKHFSELIFLQKPPSFERWIGYRSFLLSIEKEKRYIAPQKIKRYSGWRRHQNDQGSIAPQKEDPFPLEPDVVNDKLSLFLNIIEQVKSGKSEIFINNLKVILC